MTPQIKQRIEQIWRGEVPSGYKKTKIGVVPNEWVYEKLENYTEAKKMYEKALKIYPNYPHVRDKKYPNILKKIYKK